MVIADLDDPTKMHRTIMRGFPSDQGDTPRASLGVLFRVEPRLPGRDAAGPTVLVQSAVAPEWTSLPEGYALATDVREASVVGEVLAEGASFSFRLVAYPSEKISRGPGGAARASRHSRRVALEREDTQLAWLNRRGERHGFAVDQSSVGIVDLGYQGGGPRAAGLRIRQVLFEGHLRVTDANLLREAIVQGIGPAKAYGCGLLSIASAR